MDVFEKPVERWHDCYNYVEGMERLPSGEPTALQTMTYPRKL
jgi:hypothetical protein